MRLAQPICGFAVFTLAVWLWWSMFLWTPADKRKFDSNEAWFILLMVGPGLCLLVAGFLQAMYRWVWPTVLAVLASLVAPYMGVVVWWLFGYSGHGSSLPLVYVYLVVLLLTLVASVVNATLELVQRFSKTGVEQVVGPARG